MERGMEGGKDRGRDGLDESIGGTAVRTWAEDVRWAWDLGTHYRGSVRVQSSGQHRGTQELNLDSTAECCPGSRDVVWPP